MTNPEPNERACSEYRSLSRRGWLRAAVPLVAAASAPAWLPRVALGRDFVSNRDVLVHVFLRGGMDGLTTCAPYGDAQLYTARPTLAIQPPGQPNGAVDLDGFFGVPPAAAPFLTPYQAGHLAFVHASGSPDPTRSHFDAYKFMEYGIPGQSLGSIDTGWLARHLQVVPPVGSGPLRGVSLSLEMPYTLQGAPATLPIADLGEFSFPGRPESKDDRRAALATMYGVTGEPLHSAALDTFDTVDLLEQIDFRRYRPSNGAVYPGGPFGKSLKSAAALIKADVGVECVMLDLGGWDHHNQEGPINGVMAQLLDLLSRSVEAFYLDMLDRIDRTVLVALSEFGRRVEENASAGVDHGHGNCMMVMGGGIRGGQVLRNWPGLAPEQRDNGDLAITIDYRDILAEILDKRMGDTQLDQVFPGYSPVYRGITI